MNLMVRPRLVDRLDVRPHDPQLRAVLLGALVADEGAEGDRRVI